MQSEYLKSLNCLLNNSDGCLAPAYVILDSAFSDSRSFEQAFLETIDLARSSGVPLGTIWSNLIFPLFKAIYLFYPDLFWRACLSGYVQPGRLLLLITNTLSLELVDPEYDHSFPCYLQSRYFLDSWPSIRLKRIALYCDNPNDYLMFLQAVKSRYGIEAADSTMSRYANITEQDLTCYSTTLKVADCHEGKIYEFIAPFCHDVNHLDTSPFALIFSQAFPETVDLCGFYGISLRLTTCEDTDSSIAKKLCLGVASSWNDGCNAISSHAYTPLSHYLEDNGTFNLISTDVASWHDLGLSSSTWSFYAYKRMSPAKTLARASSFFVFIMPETPDRSLDLICAPFGVRYGGFDLRAHDRDVSF
ncbi:MAG: hypothetical protein KXJ49_06860 [Vulcanococcus sp.]|uniref:hypothetical protein n=1 Tax=Vulcanococcus sp. TaxID=2856995 RepID=UPI0025EA9AFE|nr:hypothetical protein [Vulcanococcus sp.]MBW0167199.1 hypothetical protein [Vulcanococcus sp.]